MSLEPSTYRTAVRLFTTWNNQLRSGFRNFQCTENWCNIQGELQLYCSLWKTEISSFCDKLPSASGLPRHVFLVFICRFVGGLLESGDGAWIGLNDRSKESRYLWNYNKFDTPRYFAWDETNPSNTEPNNFNGQCNVESCVEMKTINKKWNDAVCIAHRNFLCERESKKGEGWHVIYHR